jgi:hypothetical protein
MGVSLCLIIVHGKCFFVFRTEESEAQRETSAWNKFKLLLWKNFKIQTRHKVQTVVELLIPLVFAIVLAIIRMLIESEKIPEPSIYDAFNVKGNPPAVIKTLTYVFYVSQSVLLLLSSFQV